MGKFEYKSFSPPPYFDSNFEFIHSRASVFFVYILFVTSHCSGTIKEKETKLVLRTLRDTLKATGHRVSLKGYP